MSISLNQQLPIRTIILAVLIMAAGFFLYFIWGADTADAKTTSLIAPSETAVDVFKRAPKVSYKPQKEAIKEIAPEPVSVDDFELRQLEEIKRQQIEARRRAPVVVYSAKAPKVVPASKEVQAETVSHLEYKLIQGKTISGILETAIHSDLPGMVRAIVNENVYGEKGNIAIIPKGSRLVGQYQANTELGQSRLFVSWERVIRPDGISVQLDSPGTDAIGRAGLSGKVDTHFKERFGNAVLLSVIAAGTSNINVGKEDRYNSMSAYRQGISSSFQQSATDSIEKNYQVGPTIEVKQGTRIQVLVAKDLSFYEVLHKA